MTNETYDIDIIYNNKKWSIKTKHISIMVWILKNGSIIYIYRSRSYIWKLDKTIWSVNESLLIFWMSGFSEFLQEQNNVSTCNEYNSCRYERSKVFKRTKLKKRRIGLNGHQNIRDFTLISCQKGSYLHKIRTS